MLLSDFDKFFPHLPPFDREDDFKAFWDKAVSDVKKIPLNMSLKQKADDADRFDSFVLVFKSFMKTQISGELLLPKHTDNPHAVIVIHDYNCKPEINEELLDDKLAYFFILLRGHSILYEANEATEGSESPDYLIENILDKETYYLKALYLDVLRSVDALRLTDRLNCSRISIIGKGLGAAAGLFTAVNSDRVAALALHTPSFCYLSLNQNESDGFSAKEINKYIALDKINRKKIKQNLSYFDAMNFADMVRCPVLATVGMKDTVSPPSCVFALFNHLLCEKTIEVYPDEGNSAGGDRQFKKSILWIKKLLLKTQPEEDKAAI